MRETRRSDSPRKQQRGAAPQRTQRPKFTPDPPNVDRLLGRQPWSKLRDLLPGDAAGHDEVMARIRAYAKLLLTWNQGVSNLISRNDEIRLVDRHIAESLAPSRLLAASGCERFVDFGSGGGLPGVPLSLAGVGSFWTLVESRRNKTLFLRKVQQDLKLNKMDIRTDRLEMLLEKQDQALECDGFTSRATATLAPTLELAGQIVRKGGKAFLWKGSGHVEELEADGSSWAETWKLVSVEPILAGPNVVCVFERL